MGLLLLLLFVGDFFPPSHGTYQPSWNLHPAGDHQQNLQSNFFQEENYSSEAGKGTQPASLSKLGVPLAHEVPAHYAEQADLASQELPSIMPLGA